MDRYEHSFKTAVARVDYGRMAYHGVFLPDALLETLPDARKPGFRLKAEVAGVLITCGLMAARKARYILFSNAFLKQAARVCAPTLAMASRSSSLTKARIPCS